MWRDSVVGGALQGGRVQLDWRDVGTLKGHSGGPVCEKESGLLVGVLSEGSEAGHFDRLITLAAVRMVWKELPRPWLFAGENARMHFAQRAAGRRSIASGGDLFRGRQVALTVVRDWLCAAVVPGVPLVITAQPGAGKSAVLARAALAIEHDGQADGVAFHARGAAVADLVDALSTACGLDTPPSWQELVEAVATQQRGNALVIALDALDEAASEKDVGDLRQVLRELARLPWLRIAVATRPLAARDVYGPGTHLHTLGVIGGANSRNLVDLDTDRFFAAEDLIAYAYALLAQEGTANPGPPGGAWKWYQHNDDARALLAHVVASRADRNYLVAGMSAFQLAEQDTVLDPASPVFDLSVVPRGIGDALSKHLDRLPAPRRRREVGLLTALAYARGVGLEDALWVAFAQSLGYQEVTTSDLTELKDSAAADYLLETSANPGGLVTRLFHQALADELVTRRNRPADEAGLLQLLQNEGAERNWLTSSLYARSHAPSHAAQAGLLNRLVRQADFMASMTPTSMRSALTGLLSGNRHDPIAIYDIALPFLTGEPGINAAVLEFISKIQGNQALAQELGELGVRRPYKLSGNIRPFDVALARFDGHTGGVRAVAAVVWPGLDHQVIVTGSMDGTARVWDPLDPGQELARFDGHTSWVDAVAAVDWPGLDHQVFVTGSMDSTARVWDPLDPGQELARFNGHTGGVAAAAAVVWTGLDHQVIVTGSMDSTARVWDPLDPGQELARFDGHTSWVDALAAVDWPGRDHQVIVTGSRDGTARVWDPLDPGQEMARFDGHAGDVGAVAAVDWPGLDHQVIVTGSADMTARVWDPVDPGQELARVDGHTDSVWAVAAVDWAGLDHQVIVTGSPDGTARVWNPLDPGQELARVDGHTGSVQTVAAVDWPGLDHQVIVTGSADMTAQIWDPLKSDPQAGDVNSHTGAVQRMAAVDWPGLDHQVIVTGSMDGTARVWDPLDPGQELARFDGHTSWINALAAVDWPGRDHQVIVTGSADRTARVWDPLDPGQELARFDGHTNRVNAGAAVDSPGRDHQVIVTGSADMTARVWDPLDPGQELARFDGHTSTVWAVAAVDWAGLDHQVIVTGSADGTARVWDPP